MPDLVSFLDVIAVSLIALIVLALVLCAVVLALVVQQELSLRRDRVRANLTRGLDDEARALLRS